MRELEQKSIQRINPQPETPTPHLLLFNPQSPRTASILAPKPLRPYVSDCRAAVQDIPMKIRLPFPPKTPANL